MSQRFLGIFIGKRSCGIAVMEDDQKVLYLKQIPWSSLAKTVITLVEEFKPKGFVVSKNWRNRWVQALLRTVAPDTLLVLVNPNALPKARNLETFAVSIIGHYLFRRS